MIIRVLTLAVIVFLTACSDDTSYSAEISMPLIKNCENVLVKSLEDKYVSSIVDYEIKYFNHKVSFPNYPNLIGYIEIRIKESSQDNSIEYLKSIVNAPMFDCYPLTATLIEKEHVGEKVLRVIERNKRIGIDVKNQYLVLEDDGISLYYNDETNGVIQQTR